MVKDDIKNSDIDIAVIVDSIGDDFLSNASKLFRLRIEIADRIEPHLFEEGENRSGFLEAILRTGEVIYSAQEK